MHPEKMASLILIAMAVLFIVVAVIFQSQDIGSCPLFIPGQQYYTCTIYYPGTNIPIEPTVRILVTLSVIAFGAGASIYLTSRHYGRKTLSGDPQTVGLRKRNTENKVLATSFVVQVFSDDESNRAS